MELRYIGAGTVSFLAPPVGELNPGDEFWVEDLDQARAFMSRKDIELVNEEDAALLAIETEETDESPADASEAEETPTEVQDDTTPAKTAPKKRATTTTKTADSDVPADDTAK